MDALACIDLYDCLNAGNFDPQTSPYLREVDPITSQPKNTIPEAVPTETSEASPALLEVLHHALEVMQSHTESTVKKKTSRKAVRDENAEPAKKTKTPKKAATVRKTSTIAKTTTTKKTAATTKSATKKKSATKPELTPVIVRPTVETIPGIKKYAFIYSGNLSSK